MALTDFKIHVSYLMFGAYVAGIFLLSVILSIIISIAGVNRSNCNNNTATVVVKNVENIAKTDHFVHVKRSNEKFYEALYELKKYENTHPAYAAFRKTLKETPSCPELFSYNPNGWPWEKKRLPLNIIPNRYELEFYRPYYPQKIYNGEVGIYVNITEDVDTFVVNSNFLNVIYPFIYDSQNNSIGIKCADYYPINEYFVIRTNVTVLKSRGPLLIKLYFNGFLDKYESGLFFVNYTDVPGDFNG